MLLPIPEKKEQDEQESSCWEGGGRGDLGFGRMGESAGLKTTSLKILCAGEMERERERTRGERGGFLLFRRKKTMMLRTDL